MTREERIAKSVEEAIPLYRNVMQKAYAGTAPPRSAIKAQCLHCVGYERLMVTHCTGYSCPLWAYRPYQIRGGNRVRIDI
jgi:hypothetical protein